MPTTTWLTIGVIVSYFTLLFFISYFTSRGSNDNQSFFLANRQSPWWLVAFGMIGTTLSGVTFISVPGWVGSSQFSYFQMVLGYIAGYSIIALILLPLYYKLQLTSIYTYLNERFGPRAYKTGSFFFLLSRSVGAAFRLYLIAIVFQVFIFDQFNFPFWLAVLFTLALILIYTFKGGIKTIVWTDALQTLFMLLALVISIVYLTNNIDFGESGSLITAVKQSDYSQIFFWDWRSENFFGKQFISGAFIAIVMTGLDQDMMQKNLSCRNLKEAQTNMFSFTSVLVIVKFIFLVLGALLFMYAIENGIEIPEKRDYLYPNIAFSHFPLAASLFFILGLTAAAYSSADSALTALTTAFCVDFLGLDKKEAKNSRSIRYRVHIGFTIILFLMILAFHAINDDSVIKNIFKAAGYTYGPILGLFSFGLFMKKFKSKDAAIPVIAVLSPIITYLIATYSPPYLNGYKFGFEVLLINGIITFLGLLIFSKKAA